MPNKKTEESITPAPIYDTDVAVKAVGDWELEVRGNPYGKDRDRQWFDEGTELRAAPEVPVVYYHGIKDDRTGFVDAPILIGKATNPQRKQDGIWWHVVLDKTKEEAKKVWLAAKERVAVASSGAIDYLSRLDVNGKMVLYRKNTPGRIAIWHMGELSLWDNKDGSRPPAHPYAVAIPAMKAVYEQAGMSLPDIGEDEPKAQEKSAAKNEAEFTKGDNIMSEEKKETVGLTEDEVQAKIDAALKAQADAEKAKEERQAEIDAEVAKQVEAKTKEIEAEAAKARRLPYGQAPAQSKFNDIAKFDGISPADIAFLIDFQKNASMKSADVLPPSNEAYKALVVRMADQKTNVDEKLLSADYSKGAMKAAFGVGTVEDAVKAATDPMYSTLSGAGSQWVGTEYSRELWRVIRANANVAARIPETVVPDGFSSKYFPLESTDPTWYKVAEATAADATAKVPLPTITASQMATGNKQITLAKMGARVMYTGEMVEDSLVAFVPQLRQQLAVSGAEQMDHVVIDGDTETSASTNINAKDTTPSGQVYLVANGFRKLALVTNTANSRSGGTLDEDDYLETMFLMGTAGLGAADLSKCSFIIDPNVYKQSLKLASLKTKDVWSNATLESGVLTKLWGYEVIPSWFMHYVSATRKASTNGYIDANTAANNTTGAILAVRWDQWKLAYKRRMTMEVTRYAHADAWEIVALARWGLAFRDNEAAAISYNLTV